MERQTFDVEAAQRPNRRAFFTRKAGAARLHHRWAGFSQPSVVALIATGLVTLGLFFGFAWPNSPLLSTASAQQPQAESAEGIVERWRGTVYYESTSTDSYAMFCPWVCQGNDHLMRTQKWDLEVYEDGYVRGFIKTEILDYSYQQTKTNNSCGPVAETNYTLEGCQFAGQITQPHSEVFVEGKRELEAFTGRPILKLTIANELEECKSSWRARGVHSQTGAVVNKQEETKCSSAPYVPRTLYIETYEDGRPPRIPMGSSSSYPGNSTTQWGELIGTPMEPSLELDRELLERSVFLDQVPVEEQFTANMEWNSPDGGWLTWELSEQAPERVGPTDASELPKPINGGEQGVGRKTLTVQAQNTLKQTTEPETSQVTVAPPPAWTGGPSQISATKVEGAVVYKSTLKFPEPAFEGTVTVPKIVPWLGSKKLGIVETQGSLAWEAQSTSEGQGSLSGQTGFEAMGGAVIGSLTGRAKIILDAAGVRIPEGGIDFGIAGKIESEPESLLSVVPSLRPALVAIEKISTRAATFIRERAQAKLELAPKLDFGFNFFTENDEIKFKSAEAKPGFGFKTIVELKLIEDVLQATASIGGSIAATFQVPEPYFKEAVLQGLVQAQIILYRWAWEGEKAWSTVISGGAAAAGAGGEQVWEGNSGSGSWQLLDRSYLDAPNYARWRGDDAQAQAELEGKEDLILVENVFPQANPSLHVWSETFGTTQVVRVIQAWAHDTQSDGEIAYSKNSGTSWQNPIHLTNDSYDDLAPKVVYLSGSDAMILWQRMDVTTPPSFEDDPAGYLSHWQIAAQTTVNAANNKPLHQLSVSGSLNYRHQLGATDEGALAVWVNNPANQIFGDSTYPDDILYARYQVATKSWITGTSVLDDVAGLIDLDLATNGQHAALVYSRDTDGDLSTDADQELFYVTWNGSAWSNATRLTNNGVADDSPQLALDESGAPLLVWRQNGELKFRQGGWNSAPVVLNLPGAAERTDYELVRSPDGKLALVWQEVEPNVTLVGYAIYDPAHGRWSSQRTLTPPENSGVEAPATFMATGITAGILPVDAENFDGEVNGHLLLAYQLAHVEHVTLTVEGVTVTGAARIGQHDLRIATLPLAVNLSVSPADLSLPAAGKLQAVIRNTGDLAVQNVPVALQVGPVDPVTGKGTNVVQNVPLIAAGSAATLTYSLDGRSETIFAVEIDPERTLVESTRADNYAALGADLAITPLPATYTPHGTVVRAQLTQNSPRYVSLVVTSTLSLEEPDGPVIGWTQIGFPLTPSAGVVATTFISPTQLGPGRHFLFWTVDPGETMGETDRSNNVAGTMIMVLPDLTAPEESVYFGTAPGSTTPFSMRVQNLGNWPNQKASLQVFDGPPGEPGSHSLLKLAIPAIEPGGYAELSGNLQLAGLPAATSGLSGLYIQLDPEGSVDESDENNNLIASGAVLEAGGSGGGSGYPLYLPLLEK